MAPHPSTSSASQNVTISHLATREQDVQSDSDTRSSRSERMPSIHSREEAKEAIVASLVQILGQPLRMLRDGTIGDQQLSTESQLIPGSSLGKHFRHVHDHFRVLLDSVEYHSGQRTGSPIAVDYDKRMRVVPLETNARVALKEFEDTQKRIDSLLGNSADIWETDLDRHVTLNATTPTEVSLGSTLGREMWFVCLHAIHHYALARVILVHELGLSIDDDFGVAPSTLVLRLWQQASQPVRSKL